eukprot:TRINITY_DN49755_c0_g1_i1.p1 TRINITY_DN49755_c0_g1~~TRINITY_DN49755_c0_g1_i1.p1  ORF type:complete len:334 (-),score=78.95 TRINITY_DN49755_c0_g1_i1:252-1253(-)
MADELQAGMGTFQCGEQTVFYYLPPPDRFDPAAYPLMVLHGVKRDAQVYFDALMATGEVERLGVFVMVPEFSEQLFPKLVGYNFGNVFAKNPENYKPPKKSTRTMPELTPTDQWAFTALERCFEQGRDRANSRAERYNLFGHSAGAQFAHRFLLFMGAAAVHGLVAPLRVSRCISANAGWYTMPEIPPVYRLPYGMLGFPPELVGGGAGSDEVQVISQAVSCWLAQPLLLLLGEQDIDPKKPSPKVWRDTDQANAQGLHRFERGHSFFGAAQRAAENLGTECNWEMATVPTVGHHGGAMSAVALSMFYDPTTPEGQVDLSVLDRVSGANSTMA